jgi:hypothetical protein
VEVTALYVTSSMVGAAALIAAARVVRLVALTVLPDDVGGGAVAAPAALAAVALYALLAAGSRRLPRPMWNRQVPLVWRARFGPLRASVAYSFVLGAAIFTRINSPAIYLLPVAGLLAPSWPLALTPALLYAFARAASVAAGSIAFADWYARDFEGLMAWIGRQRLVWTAVQAIVLAAAAAAGFVVSIVALRG